MIRIILGDITEVTDVDVIVNSAKKALLGGGGVDGAIHCKAGRELLRACRELHGCNTGEAKITKGYELQIPYIIHAVGPIHHSDEWAKEYDCNQEELLRQAYLNSLRLAKEYNLKKIAFSAISTGAYGYPAKESTKIALDTITEFLKYNHDFEITLVLYTEDFYNEYINQIKNYNTSFSAEKREIDFQPMASIRDSRNLYKDIFDNNHDSTDDETNNEETYNNIKKEGILKKIINKIFKN